MTLNNVETFGNIPESANQKCSADSNNIPVTNVSAAPVASDGMTDPSPTKSTTPVVLASNASSISTALPNGTATPVSKPLAPALVANNETSNHLVTNAIVPVTAVAPGVRTTASVPIAPTPTSATLSHMPPNRPAGSNAIPTASTSVTSAMHPIPTLMQPTALCMTTPVVTSPPSVGSVPLKPENKLPAVPKQRAVPILPKSTPILPRVVTLAPRPTSVIPPTDVSNMNAVDGSRVGLRDEDDASDKGKRTSRARMYTEHDDFTLINFWASNYDLFCKSSKLSFARRAAEYMNTVFSKSAEFPERGLTHEKQVHNKICYLVRRYESVRQKYLSGSTSSDVNSDGYGRTVMQLADADFPYFSKMHSFMSSTQPTTYVRKRKIPRSSLDSLPDVVIPENNGESPHGCVQNQLTPGGSATLHDCTGMPLAKAHKVEGNQAGTNDNDTPGSVQNDGSTNRVVAVSAGMYQERDAVHGGDEVRVLQDSCHNIKALNQNSGSVGKSSVNGRTSAAGNDDPLKVSGSKGDIQDSQGRSVLARVNNQNDDDDTEMMESIVENGANSTQTGACINIDGEVGNDASRENVDGVMDDGMEDSNEEDGIDEVLVERTQVGQEIEGSTVDEDGGDIQGDEIIKDTQLMTSSQGEKEYYSLRKKELVLRSREAKRLEAELLLREREFECRRMELKSQGDLQMVQQLRESAKVFLELGMNGNGYKCMERVALLLKL